MAGGESFALEHLKKYMELGTPGKPIGNPGKPWENYAKTRGKPRKTMGKQWEHGICG